MQNRGKMVSLAELETLFDDDEEIEQIEEPSARPDQRWWIELVILALLVALFYYGGLI